MNTTKLAHLLTLIASELDDLGYPRTGAIRAGARLLMSTVVPDDDRPTCRGCGSPLAYLGRGRPRVWCAESCRSRNRDRQRPQMRSWST